MSTPATRPRGMHPDAWAALQKAFADARITLRIVQTCGFATASAGTHGPDGTLPNGEKWSAAVDLSTWKVRGVLRYDEAHLRWMLYQMARHGFIAFYRHTGSFLNNKHVHGVYAGVPMKPMLRAQVRDYLAGKNGLAGHVQESFWRAGPELDAQIKTLYLQHNPL